MDTLCSGRRNISKHLSNWLDMVFSFYVLSLFFFFFFFFFSIDLVGVWLVSAFCTCSMFCMVAGHKALYFTEY